MDDADNYDEFGNYIGPEVNETASIIEEYNAQQYYEEEHDMQVESSLISTPGNTSAVVLHEDKKYFPSASEVYGETVQVLVEEEDAQPLTEPIIAPIKEIMIDNVSSVPVKMKYSIE